MWLAHTVDYFISRRELHAITAVTATIYDGAAMAMKRLWMLLEGVESILFHKSNDLAIVETFSMDL